MPLRSQISNNSSRRMDILRGQIKHLSKKRDLRNSMESLCLGNLLPKECLSSRERHKKEKRRKDVRKRKLNKEFMPK